MQRKHIYWIAALLVLAFAGDRLGGWLLGKMVSGSQFRYSKLYDGRSGAEILFLGNSRGLMFYQPYIEEITGKTTANLSYNGLPMDLGKILLEDYLEHNAAPELLILDVTMCDRRNAPLIVNFSPYLPYSSRLDTLVKSNNSTAYWGTQVSHLYRYNGEVFQRALYHYRKTDEDWLIDRVITDDLISSLEKEPPYTIDIQSYLMEQLGAAVRFAQARNIQIHLVINPYYPPFADKITNLEAFKAAVIEATGLPVYDYARSVTDVAGFGDYQHLNKEGSKQYLDQLFESRVLGASMQ